MIGLHSGAYFSSQRNSYKHKKMSAKVGSGREAIVAHCIACNIRYQIK